MSELKVKDKDHGYARLRKTAAQAARGGTLAVGVLDGSTQADGAKQGITVGDVATWNEFGLGVPERSFLRAWYDEALPANKAAFRRLWALVVKGQRTHEWVFETLGIKFAADIQRRIVAHIPPPNAPATIAAKGSSTPLIDSSQLKNSITYEVRP